MNILIVGNGFDLSHYLPTKYEHFIKAMDALRRWDIQKGDIDFNNLFQELCTEEAWFFDQTKFLYRTEKIIIRIEEVEKIKAKLNTNIWYKYFLNHITKIDTWIDFESEFSKALDLVARFSQDAENIYQEYEEIRPRILGIMQSDRAKYLKYGDKTIQKLFLLGIFEDKNSQMRIANKYYRNNKENLDIDSNSIIENLEKNLNEFINIFKWYLKEIIEKLELTNVANKEIFEFNLEDLSLISFNYTSTFSRFYNSLPKVEYVHGEVNKDLVLGIPDIKNEFLKKFKNYSFTKYHQKLLKNTDYLFLDENPKIKEMFKSKAVGKCNINIYIWGHSLADSDESYIHEIFSLNRQSNIECYVTVYFHKNDAPKLLNNLLDILGKDIVEKWMKNGWLWFKPNPEIQFQVNSQQELDEVS